MPIDRTNYNALVDDPGDGLTGTMWNKAQIKSVLLDPIDAEIVAPDSLAVGNGQILFPATANPSPNGYCLDDYRENLWGPILTGTTAGSGGQAYTQQTGEYIKIGRFVLASFVIQLSNKGTINGNVRIAGLPFPISNTISSPYWWALRWYGFVTSFSSLMAMGTQGQSYMDLFGFTAAIPNATDRPVTAADLAANSWILGTCLYAAAS